MLIVQVAEGVDPLATPGFQYIPTVGPVVVLNFAEVTERGTSSIYKRLLTKADVLNASTEQGNSHGTIKRMVGGFLLSNLRSAMGWTSSKLRFVKNVLGMAGHPYARVGHDVLSTLGHGKSGAGTSGGSLQNRLTE